jgi:membrane-associated phospholipid phosphatase
MTLLPHRVPHRAAAAAVLCLGCASAPAWADGNTRAANILQYALPAGVLAYELLQDSRQGQIEYGESLALTLGATHVLKHTVHEERPDHSNDLSFPSGHASGAFAAATFVHRRYGLEDAWPLYAGAFYVGYARVHAHRHHWGDVAGSAALSAASTWWLVEPKENERVSVVPMVGPQGVGLMLTASW